MAVYEQLTQINQPKDITEDRFGMPVLISPSEQAFHQGYLDYETMRKMASWVGYGPTQAERAYWAAAYDLGHHEALSGLGHEDTFTGHDFPIEIVHTSKTFLDSEGVSRPMNREMYLRLGYGEAEDLTKKELWMLGVSSLRLFAHRMWKPNKALNDGDTPHHFDEHDSNTLQRILALSPRMAEQEPFPATMRQDLEAFNEARRAGHRYAPKLYQALAERAAELTKRADELSEQAAELTLAA